jgi:integration host factor subunit beta
MPAIEITRFSRLPWLPARAAFGLCGGSRQPVVTKSELIEAVAEQANLTKGRAELVVNTIFDAMTDALRRGDGIEIRGFGSFTVRQYRSYEGRNPRTGDAVHVAPKRLPFFKVGKELRERVNGRWTGEPLVVRPKLETEPPAAPRPAMTPAPPPPRPEAGPGEDVI